MVAQHANVTWARLQGEFEVLEEALKRAKVEENHWEAAKVAVGFNMVEIRPTKGPGTAGQKDEQGYTLWFQWRYYDQSRPFSLQKDMNILSLELRDGDKVLRRAEERFED